MKNIKLYELRKLQTEFPKKQIKSSKDVYDFISQFYNDDMEIFESFFLLLLDNGLNTIGYVKISQGGITGTVVDVRLVAKYAVESLATNVILAHNHPSGMLKPSPQDIHMTKKIQAGLSILDIKVCDHIILTSNGYYSFSDEDAL
jgi:DNA repair protein RadC